MRSLLVLGAFGLTSAQVGDYRDTFSAATGTHSTNNADANGALTNVGDYANNDSAGSFAYVTGADAAADRAAERSTASNGTFKAALNQLASLLKDSLDEAKASLDTQEQNFDKAKCNFEKTIKKNDAKAADEQKRLDEATAQHAKWDAQHKKFEGEKTAEQNAMEATHTPIANACDSWKQFVCTGSDSLLNQLKGAVDDAALMYAALQKLAERRAEFNFGATLGLMQLKPEEAEKVELTEQDISELQRIDGVTGLIQNKIKQAIHQPYGAGAGGVVGALKGIYDTVVTNAQRLVEQLNDHGISGNADYLDSEVTTANCVELGLGGCDNGNNCAACPLSSSAYTDAVWDRIKPAGADTFSALMRTQLAQRRAHKSKFEFITTSWQDANNQRAMWSSKEDSAAANLKAAQETSAVATRDLQAERSAYDKNQAESQDLIRGLSDCLETISDPAIIDSTTGDAATFIQIEAPPSLIQTSVHKAKVELMQKVELSAQADGFQGVIGAMQKMIANLQVQIQDELDRKAWCTDEKEDASDAETAMSTDVQTLKSNLQNMQDDIKTYQDDIDAWESHAKDIEDAFNGNMDTCSRDLTEAQKEKDDAQVNERMYSKILGVLSNIRLPTTGGSGNVRNLLLCDGGGQGWGCTTDGHVVRLLNEARRIQDSESERIEDIHKWCNSQRDIYAENIRNAKSNLAQQNVFLATVREEARKTDAQLLHANEAFKAAEQFHDDIEAQCAGLLNGSQMKGGEWAKEITAMTSIIEMLTTGA